MCAGGGPEMTEASPIRIRTRSRGGPGAGPGFFPRALSPALCAPQRERCSRAPLHPLQRPFDRSRAVLERARARPRGYLQDDAIGVGEIERLLIAVILLAEIELGFAQLGARVFERTGLGEGQAADVPGKRVGAGTFAPLSATSTTSRLSGSAKISISQG